VSRERSTALTNVCGAVGGVGAPDPMLSVLIGPRLISPSSTKDVCSLAGLQALN
jgi:hypothetical protein